MNIDFEYNDYNRKDFFQTKNKKNPTNILKEINES